MSHSITKHEQEQANGTLYGKQPSNTHKDEQNSEQEIVAFITEWDMMLLRFARQLQTVSSDRIIFSTRRYGYLTGQIPNVETEFIKKTKSIPTNEKNIEDRLFLCLKTGSYAVERALVVLQTAPDRVLNKITLIKVLQNKQLMVVLVDLALSIFDENTWYTGRKFVQKFILNDLGKVQNQYVKLAAYVVNNKMGVEASEESKQPVEQILTTYSVRNSSYLGQDERLNREPGYVPTRDTRKQIEDEMLTGEIKHYKRISNMEPLHHFLRLCIDAAYIKEEDFMLVSFTNNERQYIWDVPADVKIDCLAMHTNKHLTGSIISCTYNLLNTQQAIRQMYGHSTTNFHNEQDVFEWVLKDRKRLVLFANLVLCDHYDALSRSRQTNTKPVILTRIRTSYNDLLTYFKLLMQ